MNSYEKCSSALEREAAPHLAGDRRRRLHRLATWSRRCSSSARASSASTTSPPASRDNLTTCATPVGEARWARFRFIEGDIRSLDACRARLRRRRAACCTRRRSAACRARSTIRSRANDSNVDRLPQHAGGRARRGREALRLRQLERRLRRPSGAAQGRGDHRPRRCRPTALTKYVNELYADVFGALLRLQNDRPALLQRVRPAPGSGRRLCRGDPGVDRRAAARPDRRTSTATARRRATSATSTTWCRRTCSPPPVEDAARSTRSTTSRSASRPRSTSCFEMIRELLVARACRTCAGRARGVPRAAPGDVRFSRADIRKAESLLGYRAAIADHGRPARRPSTGTRPTAPRRGTKR